jgi:hypothetical protein
MYSIDYFLSILLAGTLLQAAGLAQERSPGEARGLPNEGANIPGSGCGKRILKMGELEISRWKLQDLKLDRHPLGKLVQFKIL